MSLSSRRVAPRRLIAGVGIGALFLGALVAAPAHASSDALSNDRGLSDRLAEILDGTYDSLSQRLETSGYTPTSLTGEYDGMFVRDAAIQATAMMEAGNSAAARAILDYLVGYGAERALPRPPRHLPAEDYRVVSQLPVAAGDPSIPTASYADMGAATPLLKINGPSHGAAMAFVAGSSDVTRVELGLLSLNEGPGTTTVTIREEVDWNAAAVGSATASSVDFHTSDGKPVWHSFDFAQPLSLVPGRTYYVMVQASAEPDTVVQLWGSQQGGSGVQRTYNYDGGQWQSGPIPGRGLFKVFTTSGLSAGNVQSQTVVQGALFQVQGSNHQAAQPFQLVDDILTNAWIPLVAESSVGQVTVSVRTDYTDPATQVAFGSTSLDAVGAQVTWLQVPITVDAGKSIAPGQRYYLVVRANVPDPTQKVMWFGASFVDPLVGAGWNYDQSAYGGWHAENHSLGFAVNVTSVPRVGPMFTDVPSTVVGTAGGSDVFSGAFSTAASVTGLDLYLAAADQMQGTVEISIADSTGRTSTATVPASEITATGSWHRLTFSTLGRGGDDTYTVTVKAAQTSPETILVYGEADQVAHQALTLVYEGEEMMDQPDGSYMLVDAWARYVKENPDDIDFVNDTYGTIAAWSDYYLTNEYLNDSLKLMYNPRFEHSRRHYQIPTYDLMTNVFASQALAELAQIATDIPGQQSRAQHWQDRAEWLEDGIKNNLVSTVQIAGESKQIYTELLWSSDGRDGTLTEYPGYSWVNFAPVAADWYALDWDLMRNTYEAYIEHGSIEWTNSVDDQVDLMLMMDTEENTWEPANPPEVWYYERYAVIGKGLGWELMTARELGREDRLATIGHFVEVHTPGPVLGEFYYAQGPSDVGNQEQGSWWVLGMLAAYPRTIVGTAPVIQGIAQVGETLTALPGTWTQDAHLTYQWFADDEPLPGTGTTLRLDNSHQGKTVSVSVTGTRPGYQPLTRRSNIVGPVAAAPQSGLVVVSRPQVTGNTSVGQSVRVTPGSYSPAAVESYQWSLDGRAVPGATASTYTLRAADAGKRLSVTVKAVAAGDLSATTTLAAGTVARGTIAVKKKPQLKRGKKVVKKKTQIKVGHKLKTTKGKVSTPGAKAKIKYRWFIGKKKVKGKKGAKRAFKVTKKAAGKRVHVRVTYKAPGYTDKTVKSKKTPKIRR